VAPGPSDGPRPPFEKRRSGGARTATVGTPARGKLLNRAFTLVYEHALLKDRVDLQNDRVLGTNKNWLSAKAVVDIMRALQTDRVDGRITAKREQE